MFLTFAGRLLKRFATLAFPLVTAVAIAQAPAGACTAMVQEALLAANAACGATQRNEVCYGNLLGEATPAEGVTSLNFENVGDIAPLNQIQSLQLSPLDEAAQQWGVALMQLQANLPDTLPGQNVTFLLFGDVAIEDAADEQVRVPATALRASNVRVQPSTTAEVIGSLPSGAEIQVTGKWLDAAGEVWLRVKYENYRTRTGWVYGNLIDVAFDSLPLVDSNSRVLNPMQAFYFKTGIGRTTCAEAPTSGVVVQTPEGAGLVNFNVNGVDIALGSTAVISGEGEMLNVALLEGTGTVEYGGIRRQLVPGSESSVNLGEMGELPPVPTVPQPIAPRKFTIISDVLKIAPREVIVPAPATKAQIDAANSGGSIPVVFQMPACPPGTPPEQCACNDVDGDGQCDAVPCSEKYPTMCVPGCRDDNGDGKCDMQCADNNNDGVCDPNGGTHNNPPVQPCNGNDCPTASPTPTVDCFVPGPVICDPGCTNVDGDATCDAYDDCIDADGDGTCDCNTGSGDVDDCDGGIGSVPTPTPTPGKDG